LLDAANSAGKKNWPITEAECWHYAGGFYFSEAMYVPAFEYMQKAQNVFDEYEYGRYYIPVALCPDGIAGCYYRFVIRRSDQIHEKEKLLPAWWNVFILFSQYRLIP
jgi:hypothetical protein